MPVVRFFDRDGHKQEQQDPEGVIKDEVNGTSEDADEDEADGVTGHASGVGTINPPEETPNADD